jgi:hypothetical protein
MSQRNDPPGYSEELLTALAAVLRVFPSARLVEVRLRDNSWQPGTTRPRKRIKHSRINQRN